MQKVPHCNTENTPCDRYKGDLLGDIQREKVKRGLRSSPLTNSYINASTDLGASLGMFI